MHGPLPARGGTKPEYSCTTSNKHPAVHHASEEEKQQKSNRTVLMDSVGTVLVDSVSGVLMDTV